MDLKPILKKLYDLEVAENEEKPPEDNAESIQNKIKLLKETLKNTNEKSPAYLNAIEEIKVLEKRLSELKNV